MDINEINKKLQIEKDSYARDLNRLQQEIFKLKQRHLRTMNYWNRLKEQSKKQNTNENIFKITIDEIVNLL